MNIWQKRAPGVLLCLAVALLAWFLVELAPALEIVGSAVLAILFGMVLCAVMKNKDKVKDGVAFTSKKVLQYAVILLGFGLNLRKIGEVGPVSYTHLDVYKRQTLDPAEKNGPRRNGCPFGGDLWKDKSARTQKGRMTWGTDG